MNQVRTIFLSDIHLGTRACQAERLLSFLRNYRSDKLFLVGDIIDFWAMRRSIHWTPAQNTFVQKILKRARHGTEVLLIPGNHDEALRDYTGISFGDIRIEREHVHVTADGRRFLIIHGDEYDQVTRHHRWVAVMGDMAYNFLVILNGWLSRMRRLLNIPGYWSLAGYAKRQVKSAVSFIFDFEDSVVHGVQQRGLDGVVCGHIHSATIREHLGVCYVNCGDWVDSCTAIVEHFDGRLELIEWVADDADPASEDEDLPRGLAAAGPTTHVHAPASAPVPVEASVVAPMTVSADTAVHERLSEGLLRLAGGEFGQALSELAQYLGPLEAAAAPALPEPPVFFAGRAML